MHAKRLLLLGITIQIPGGHSSHLHFYSCYAQNKADLPVSLTKKVTFVASVIPYNAKLNLWRVTIN